MPAQPGRTSCAARLCQASLPHPCSVPAASHILIIRCFHSAPNTQRASQCMLSCFQSHIMPLGDGALDRVAWKALEASFLIFEALRGRVAGRIDARTGAFIFGIQGVHGIRCSRCAQSTQTAEAEIEHLAGAEERVAMRKVARMSMVAIFIRVRRGMPMGTCALLHVCRGVSPETARGGSMCCLVVVVVFTLHCAVLVRRWGARRVRVALNRAALTVFATRARAPVWVAARSGEPLVVRTEARLCSSRLRRKCWPAAGVGGPGATLVQRLRFRRPGLGRCYRPTFQPMLNRSGRPSVRSLASHRAKTERLKHRFPSTTRLGSCASDPVAGRSLHTPRSGRHDPQRLVHVERVVQTEV